MKVTINQLHIYDISQKENIITQSITYIQKIIETSSSLPRVPSMYLKNIGQLFFLIKFNLPILS